MLPTFVIGLREGLEAALIVSIIATFLRRNAISLRPMWIGVVAAVALSIGVGVVLQVVEQALPQREQEAMETVIGVVAVFFVTGMILWMRTHARFMKRDLESAATAALGSGTARALAVMAFLAVLREGFETSVFLLSTFQASTTMVTAAGGAVLGIVVAVGIGVGIYHGGVRLNLTAFFKYTGIFLIFVAAGLVLNALRTAHEAGWVSVGQGSTLDLQWLAPAGTVRTALISGVLGIPADPRVIELLGWLCYLVPVLAITLLPARALPSARLLPRVRAGFAAAFVVAAVALFTLVSFPTTDVATSAPLTGGGTATLSTRGGDSATVTITRGGVTHTYRLTGSPAPDGGSADTRWALAAGASSVADLPRRLTAAELLSYTDQRAPVGLDLARDPGPYAATWRRRGGLQLTSRDGGIVAGSASGGLLLTLRGGGLATPRVISVDAPGPAQSWKVTAAHAEDVAATLADARVVHGDRALWKHWFPAALVLAALALLVLNLRRSPRGPVLAVRTPAAVASTSTSNGTGTGTGTTDTTPAAAPAAATTPAPGYTTVSR